MPDYYTDLQKRIIERESEQQALEDQRAAIVEALGHEDISEMDHVEAMDLLIEFISNDTN